MKVKFQNAIPLTILPISTVRWGGGGCWYSLGNLPVNAIFYGTLNSDHMELKMSKLHSSHIFQPISSTLCDEYHVFYGGILAIKFPGDLQLLKASWHFHIFLNAGRYTELKISKRYSYFLPISGKLDDKYLDNKSTLACLGDLANVN